MCTLPALLATASDWTSWEDALDAPGSLSFGVDSDGSVRHRTSLYRPETSGPRAVEGQGPGEVMQELRGERLFTFDLSNNRLIASLSHRGETQHASIVTGLSPAPMGPQALRGVFVQKDLVDGGPWGFAIQSGDQAPQPFHTLPQVGSTYLDGVIPRFTARYGNLRIDLVAFAPAAQPLPTAPRALIQVVSILNQGSSHEQGELHILGGAENGHEELSARSRQAVFCLDGEEWSAGFPARAFSLAPGQRATLAFGFALGESPSELASTGQLLRSRLTLDWLGQTHAILRGRLGRLSIPESPFWAEFFERLSEQSRIPALYLDDGRLGGTFIGSGYEGAKSIWSRNVWLKDSYYQMLAMAMAEPRLSADAALFFLRWGVPPQPYGRGVKRFPEAGPELHSLGLTLAPFLLAGHYYRSTGDKEFFLAHPELFDAARRRFATLLESRRDKEVYLFHSMYISDGDARGLYHSGSNVLAWYAFQHMARIAREVFGDGHAADEWTAIAGRIREDLLKHCTGPSPDGHRFFEGVNGDGSFPPEVDGEESDLGLAPFYGILEADFEPLQTHLRLGLSELNPLYGPAVDGIWWHDNMFHGSTFPAWVAALGGARDEKQLARRMAKIEGLTDLDGSIWWWPYDHNQQDASAPKRKPIKSGWAAGALVNRFVNDILGLRADVPARTVSLRPFCPWNEFAWEGARQGAAAFDLAYRVGDRATSGELVNRNDEAYAGVIELVLPAGAEPAACRINGQPSGNFARTLRYGRPAVRVEAGIPPGERLAVEIDFALQD